MIKKNKKKQKNKRLKNMIKNMIKKLHAKKFSNETLFQLYNDGVSILFMTCHLFLQTYILKSSCNKKNLTHAIILI